MEKKLIKNSISSYAAINTHIQYIQCFALTCYYIIMNSLSFNVSSFTSFIRGFGFSPPLSTIFNYLLEVILFLLVIDRNSIHRNPRLPISQTTRNIARVKSRLHCSVQFRHVRVFVIMIDSLSFYFSTALFRTELSSWSGMLLYFWLCPM